MKRYCILTVLVVSLISGCAKPDHVMTIKSPTVGVFYTVETFRAGGPTSDTTRVYAHLERNGKTKRMLVLDGGNLTVTKIIWNNPHDATLCLDGGITETFRNQVTLIVGDAPDDSETINNHLREHCDATSTTSPDVTD
jgi:hypothetical protein